MSLFHGRWRERTSLLALGALEGAAAERARAHVEGCTECARELAATRALVETIEGDPLGAAEPPVPLGALVARVRARLDEVERGVAAGAWRWRPAVAASVAVIALGVLLARSSLHTSPAGGETTASPGIADARGAESRGSEEIVLAPEAAQRLERTLERERAARYLSDAQDVLVTVAATPQRCARAKGGVEVTAETERSRELLARRRLFVEMDTPATVAARDVFDDVEELLRQVADLDPCARPRDLEAIRGEIARRRLLMKIDLVTRELSG